jgi:hypothetical protein
MQVKVHMLAFEETYKVRNVTIPDGVVVNDETMLDVTFHYGQNDFAVGPEKNTTCSLSVVDVIEDENRRLFVVSPCGFKEITIQQFAELLLMDRRDRHVWKLFRD